MNELMIERMMEYAMDAKLESDSSRAEDIEWELEYLMDEIEEEGADADKIRELRRLAELGEEHGVWNERVGDYLSKH